MNALTECRQYKEQRQENCIPDQLSSILGPQIKLQTKLLLKQTDLNKLI